jgi:hypothetical protein
VSIFNEANEEVKNKTELIGSSPLEISDKGNNWSKDLEKLSMLVPEVSYGLNSKINNEKLDKVLPNLGSIRKSNRIKNPVFAKQDDFLWLT